MRRFELMMNLIKQEQSFADQNIFETEMIEPLLNDSNHQHYFYKYFYSLTSIYGIHFDRELLRAWKIALTKSNDLLKTIGKGFSFYQFLYNYGRYEFCRELIEYLVQTLTKKVNKQETKLWIYLFRACCALIQVHNQSLEIKEAWTRIDAAHEIADNLKATGIGK